MRLPVLLALLLATPAAAAEPPFAFERASFNFDVQDNGGYTATSRIVMRVNNATVASAIGQIPIPYSPSWRPIVAVDGYIEKPDGTKLPIDPAQTRDQPMPGDASLQMFSDMRQRVVVFPTVSAGDRLVLTTKLHEPRPRVPGGFATGNALLRTLPWADYAVDITLPPGVDAGVEVDGFEQSRETRDGRTVLHLHASYPTPITNDIVVRGPYSRWPNYHVSTFKDWNAFAASYAGILIPHAAVTPKIQALADSITTGITDRRAQAAALYDWVRTHIRYVNVILANGGFDPHDADVIAANGFGDCKDHTVILHALLAAKSIPAAMVLINEANESALSTVPEPGVFNHMISYLPEFDLYVDSTNPVAPFGQMLLVEAGKPVLHIGADGPALRRTPVPPSSSDATAAVTLSADGSLSGTFSTTATGPFAVALRDHAFAYAAAGKDAAATARLKALGAGGTGTFAFDPPETPGDSYNVSGTFTPAKDPALLDGQSFTLWTGARPMDRPGDTLLGPLFVKSLPDTETTFCYPGQQSETLSLTMPPGRTVEKLPRDLTIDTPLLRFTSHWSLEGQTVKVERIALSRLPGPLCDGETRKSLAAAMQRIRDDYNRRVEIK